MRIIKGGLHWASGAPAYPSILRDARKIHRGAAFRYVNFFPDKKNEEGQLLDCQLVNAVNIKPCTLKQSFGLSWIFWFVFGTGRWREWGRGTGRWSHTKCRSTGLVSLQPGLFLYFIIMGFYSFLPLFFVSLPPPFLFFFKKIQIEEFPLKTSSFGILVM